MATEHSDFPEASDDAACQSADFGHGSVPVGRQESRGSQVHSADVEKVPPSSSLQSSDGLTRDDGQEKPAPTRNRFRPTVSSETSTQRHGGGRPATAPSVRRKAAEELPGLRRRTKEILRAKKARKDKHFSKIAFISSDPNYYNLLPVQPAVGWWKCVLMHPKHSLAFVCRLASNLDVIIPDTVFCSGTECFYISSGPEGMLGTPDSDALKQDHTGGAGASNGWVIKSDFSAAKLLENNLFTWMHADEQARLTGETGQLAPTKRRTSTPGPWNNPERSEQGGDRRQRGSISCGRTSQLLEGTGLEAQLQASPPYPAAVMKQMHYMRKDCNITKAVDLTTLSSVSSDSSVERVYQAFVRGKLRSRCQLTRVCWSACRAPSGFTLVNRLTPQQARNLGGDLTSQFCVSCDNPTLNGVSRTAEEEQLRKADPDETSFDVFPVAGATLAAAAQVAKSIFHFTQTLFRVWLETLVVDLVKGPSSTWYFIQVKSFTVRQASPTMPITFSSSAAEPPDESEDDIGERRRKKSCENISRLAIPAMCQMCGLKHRKQDLSKTVNLRMMLETQHHMRKRGVDILFFPLSGRLQLSYNYPVCSLCYSLYLAERELIKAELDLAQALRQPMPSREPTFFSFTGVLDAIQSSTQPDDPYLIDLLRSFNNAPPRQTASFAEQGKGDNEHSSINLQIDRAKERDPLLAFVHTDEDPRRSVAIPTVQGSSKPRNSVAFSVPSTSSLPPSTSSLTAAHLSRPAPGGSPSYPVSPHHPSAASHASAATAGLSAGPTAPRASSKSRNPPRHRILTGSGAAVAPPKQTLRGGEAVMGGSLTKEDRCRQLPPKLYQWRMMLFVHSLQDLPGHLLLPEDEKPVSDDERQEVDSASSQNPCGPQIAIELKLFGSTMMVPLATPELPGSTLASGSPSRGLGSTSSHHSAETGNASEGDSTADSLGDGPLGVAPHYVPIKRIIVLYLFSVSPTLHKVFEEESIEFRLLASALPRTSTDRGSESSCPSGPASSPSQSYPSSSVSTSQSRTRRSPVVSVCPACSRPCWVPYHSPPMVRRTDFGPTARLTAAEITGQRPYSATARAPASVCAACKSQPCFDVSRSFPWGRRPQTASSAPGLDRPQSCSRLPGPSEKRRSGIYRPSSTTALSRTSATAAGQAGSVALHEVASGSCSLQRLIGMKHSKQQTYVLLFATRGKGQVRLRLVLGLHQDMQVPSQYVCVRPYADAFLSARPYSSPCPVPADWIDCFAGSGGGFRSSMPVKQDPGGASSAGALQKQVRLRGKSERPPPGAASRQTASSGSPGLASARVTALPSAAWNKGARGLGTERGGTAFGRPLSAEASISAAKKPLFGLRFSTSQDSGRPPVVAPRPHKGGRRLQMERNAAAVRGVSPMFMLDLER
ncbi:conserved hypothetical protein [Neospora caninum Liverpool]|uniref:Uncharacterized protein n=1 Tax=Neospora caninum (strain Liverpool) TaxID=572307 RepID=F0VNR6_NEOCL|nr:conserved hypothetical protein [Neospora caninum Liverpool]CBZ55362.1 conserved hypothetical protein [Neospora caninum Liverpool]CEL70098.1 TPA: hypothetical protein BN1204_057850 [Neospora caninum Liverpool]|eukprot:XP_003885390.1 conserved hypothetical protein [Neospora caninum Liverpool]